MKQKVYSNYVRELRSDELDFVAGGFIVGTVVAGPAGEASQKLTDKPDGADCEGTLHLVSGTCVE